MNDILKKEAVIRVQKAINDFDKNLKIQILNETARTASDAAKALNCNVGAIVKSLLLKTDHEFVLCLVSGDKKCSLNKVKKLTGKKDVCMAIQTSFFPVNFLTLLREHFLSPETKHNTNS